MIAQAFARREADDFAGAIADADAASALDPEWTGLAHFERLEIADRALAIEPDASDAALLGITSSINLGDLEDAAALPACIEILNPNLTMFGSRYDIPTDADTARLSYSEMRDAQTNLYFDALPKGVSNTATLARATATGTFTWPATQIAPMHDARHHARTAPSKCAITE